MRSCGSSAHRRRSNGAHRHRRGSLRVSMPTALRCVRCCGRSSRWRDRTRSRARSARREAARAASAFTRASTCAPMRGRRCARCATASSRPRWRPSDFGTLGESLRIGPVAYVHLRVGREKGGPVLDQSRFAGSYDPAGILVGMRVKRGARFATGEAVGTVNAFNHVHLNVGWPGEEHNPLLLRLVQFEDTVPPTIPRGGVRLYDEQGSHSHGASRDGWSCTGACRPSSRRGIKSTGMRGAAGSVSSGSDTRCFTTTALR